MNTPPGHTELLPAKPQLDKYAPGVSIKSPRSPVQGCYPWAGDRPTDHRKGTTASLSMGQTCPRPRTTTSMSVCQIDDGAGSWVRSRALRTGRPSARRPCRWRAPRRSAVMAGERVTTCWGAGHLAVRGRWQRNTPPLEGSGGTLGNCSASPSTPCGDSRGPPACSRCDVLP